jgi:hypothetical protein
MTSPTASSPDWFHFFSKEERKPEYGLYNKFDDIPDTYLDDTGALKTAIETNPLETIILFPGGDQKIRFLHNCRTDGERGKLSGIFGMKKFSPVKQTTMPPLVKGFGGGSTRSSSTDARIPSVDDFKGCARGSELLELVGTGDDPVDSLQKIPQSFWAHPHLLSTLVTNKSSDVETAGEAYALTIEGMEDDDATPLTKQYYRFLVFIWAIGKGYSTVNVKLTDPNEEEGADSLMLDAQAKLNGDSGSPEKSSTREIEDTTGGRSDDSTHHHRNRSHSRSPNRRKKKHRGRGNKDRRSPSPRGRRSQSRSRNRGNRRRSRSDSPGSSHRDRNRRRRTDRSTSDSPGSREPGNHDVLRELSRSISVMAHVQNEKLQKDRVERSALGKLSERQKDLFTLLAARNWSDTDLGLNTQTTRLLGSRNPERQWNLLEDWSRRWPGNISKQGAIQFLSSGYASRVLPGGFTVFMFSPIRRRMPSDKKDRERNIRGTFEKGESLDDEAVRFYATLDYHVPTTISDAETQLEMAVLLLEAMTCRQSIATDGYNRGLEILAKNRLQVHEELAKDPMFMARYLHFLDVVFNTFCEDLGDYHARSDPIYKAKRKLRGRMIDDIDRVMRDLHHGITPNLSLPSLVEDEPSDRQTNDRQADKKESASGKISESGPEKPQWWSQNPDPISSWKLPSNKEMKNLFLISTPEGKENIQRFPNVKHHNPATTGKRPLCIKYHCRGKCRVGCPNSHMKAKSMPTEVYTQTNEAFKKAYA